MTTTFGAFAVNRGVSAMWADAFDDVCYVFYFKTIGHADNGYWLVFKAECFATYFAFQMNMVAIAMAVVMCRAYTIFVHTTIIWYLV